MTPLLKIFAEAACQGKLATYAWLGGDEEEISRRRWNVNDATLRARYDSCELEQTGGPSEGLLPLILVDGTAATGLIKTLKMASPERERSVRQKLREAKKISDKIVPHGTMRRLKTDIAKFIPCSFKQAGVIVFEETGGCWSVRGPRKKLVNAHVNQPSVTH